MPSYFSPSFLIWTLFAPVFLLVCLSVSLYIFLSLSPFDFWRQGLSTSLPLFYWDKFSLHHPGSGAFGKWYTIGVCKKRDGTDSGVYSAHFLEECYGRIGWSMWSWQHTFREHSIVVLPLRKPYVLKK